MSSITKLSIRGIRSFGQKDSEEQTIEFFNPLTIITGVNGAGKTTVIECLKYMTTGDMPRGCIGASFVHDPKVAGQAVINARVKLEFTDVTGQETEVTRILVANLKKDKIEFSSPDRVKAWYNNSGERVSHSPKIAELNRDMATSLGVSKPVLNNIIFCHQEDANWPLSEGKALKEKFDEIFGATRYIKAMDSIKEIKSDQTSNIFKYTTELTDLQKTKDKAKELAEELVKKQEKLAAANNSVSNANEELRPILKRIQEIELIEDEIASLRTEIAQCKGEEAERQLEDRPKFIFQGTDDELSKSYKECGNGIEQKSKSLMKTEKKLDTLEKSLEQKSDQKTSQLPNQVRMEQDNEQHLARICSRNSKMKKIALSMNFTGFTQERFSEDNVIEFSKLMDDALKKMKEENNKSLDEYQEQARTLYSNIQEFQNTKTKLETTVDMSSNLVREKNEDLKEINCQLDQGEANEPKLKELEEELKQVEVERHGAEGAVDLGNLTSLVKKLQQQEDEEMSRLSDEMTNLSLRSRTEAQIEMINEEKNTREDHIGEIRGRHEANVNRLLGPFPTENIRKKLADYIVSKEVELKDVQSSLQKIRGQLATKQANMKRIIDHLIHVNEEELSCYENQLMQHCGRQDVDVTLQELQQSNNALQSEKGAFTESSRLFERYIQSLQTTQAQCPLCHRGFDGQSEVDGLVQELQEKLKVALHKTAEMEKGIGMNQAKYKQMIELKPVKKSVISLKDELPNLKSKLSSINAEIDKLQTSLTDEENMLSLLEVDVSNANEMKPDIWQMDKSLGELKDLEHNLTVQSAKLSGANTCRTPKQVKAERQALKSKLNTIMKTIDQKQQQITRQSATLHRLATNVNNITSERLRLSGELQQQDKLQTQKEKLSSTNRITSREIKDAKKQLNSVKTKLNRLCKDYDSLQRKKEEKMKEHETVYSQTKGKQQDIDAYTNSINRYVSSGKEQQVEAGRQAIQHLEKNLGELKIQKEEFSFKKQALLKELADMQDQKWQLASNIQLRKKTDEISEVDQKLINLVDKLREIDQESIMKEKKILQQQAAGFKEEKNQAYGQQVILNEDVEKVEKELKSDTYRIVEGRYTDKVIELKTTEVAHRDLEKYSKALDRAILNYHQMKMAEINKIVQELWEKTYRGQDIDFIQIQSDEETGSQKRKTYNYRVVMVKGSTFLDMRARCSAGQKVLASLIIRLALAETFCLNCGILALDEPTTNLDKDNIESLVAALVDIVKSREQQRNLQLIVITHNEDFVQLFARSQYADYFYRITKNEESKSTINKLEVSSLQAMDNDL